MATGDQPLTRQEFYDAILPSLATKADLEKVKGDLTYRMIFIQLAGMAAIAAIMRFLA